MRRRWPRCARRSKRRSNDQSGALHDGHVMLRRVVSAQLSTIHIHMGICAYLNAMDMKLFVSLFFLIYMYVVERIVVRSNRGGG
jgi:hypothetical protein